MMIGHETIREQLVLGLERGAGMDAPPRLELIARHCDPALELPRDKARIFIPDLHLLCAEDVRHYPHAQFHQHAKLGALLRALLPLKRMYQERLEVIQLGDLLDVWRAHKGGNNERRVNNIVEEHQEHLALLTAPSPGGLGAKVLAGNHDYVLHQLHRWRHARELVIAEGAGQGAIKVLHGDIFDLLEQRIDLRLMSWIHSRLVKFVRWRAPDVHQLFGGRPPLETAGSFNVVVHGNGGGRPAEEILFRKARDKAANWLARRREDVRVLVTGHTHRARIVAGKRHDGRPLVLMDCGAWIGPCTFGNGAAVTANAQVGVIAGDDLRLYQLGG